MIRVLEVYETEDIAYSFGEDAETIIPVIYVEAYEVDEAIGEYVPDTSFPLGEFFLDDIDRIMDCVGKAIEEGEFDELRFKMQPLVADPVDGL